MNILERYKNLPDEDKKHLSIYCIYNDIYSSAQNNNYNISDDDTMKIQEISYQLYLDDEYNHLSAPDIAYFLTDCYSRDETFLDKIEDLEDCDILQAVVDYNLNFYKDDLEL